MPRESELLLRPDSPFAVDESKDPKKQDKNYRRYATSIERALALFDTALQVWADYISFLGRLLKALQTKPSGIDEVPQSKLIAKRLAQCLNPNLPSGVHQKALEVYACVFVILKREGLARELVFYLPGLSPLLSYASLSVKPALLSLFEDYVLPVGPETLRPAYKAIILALLPGLEEESTDEFERTGRLLQILRGAEQWNRFGAGGRNRVHVSRHFWQSLFLVIVTSPHRRFGGLAYLIRHFPALGYAAPSVMESPMLSQGEDEALGSSPLSDAGSVIYPEPGLLIRAFSAGLQDENVLVQRGFLELLVTHLPLRSDVLQKTALPTDLNLLVASAVSVVIRREMSLNRRLWTWFLGQSNSAEAGQSVPQSPTAEKSEVPADDEPRRHPGASYFESWGRGALIKGLLNDFTTSSKVPSVRSKPFRICQSLMDRWEIGSLTIDQVFRPAMQNLFAFKSEANSSDDFSEVLRSANVFFDGIQSHLIWREIINLIHEAFAFIEPEASYEKGNDKLEQSREQLELVLFVVSTFNIREEDMLTTHLPNAMTLLLSSLHLSCIRSERGRHGFHILYQLVLQTLDVLLDQLPPRVFDRSVSHNNAESSTSCDGNRDQDVIQSIFDIYQIQTGIQPQKLHSVFPEETGPILITLSSDLVVLSLDDGELFGLTDAVASLYSKIIGKMRRSYGVADPRILHSIVRLSHRLQASERLPLSHLLTLLNCLDIVRQVAPDRTKSDEILIREILTALVKSLWSFIDPGKPTHNVEAVRCLWRAHHLAPDDRLVESLITALILENPSESPGNQVTLNGARQFATLWTHTVSSTLPRSSHARPPVRSESTVDRSEKTYHYPAILSRPLLIVLDSLDEPSSSSYAFTTTWLRAIPNSSMVLNLLIQKLHASAYMKILLSDTPDKGLTEAQPRLHEAVDYAEIEYYLRTIHNLIAIQSTNIMSSLTIESGIPHNAFLPTWTSSLMLNRIDKEGQDQSTTIEEYLTMSSALLLKATFSDNRHDNPETLQIQYLSAKLLQSLTGVAKASSQDLDSLEVQLVTFLQYAVEQEQSAVQPVLIELLMKIMKIKTVSTEGLETSRPGVGSGDSRQTLSPRASLTEKPTQNANIGPATKTMSDSSLLDCLILGLSSLASRPVLDHWVRFLESSLATYTGSIFHVAMPLASCICRAIDGLVKSIEHQFQSYHTSSPISSETIQLFNTMMSALELVLAKTHDESARQVVKPPINKQPDPAQSFFGNMVSGVFTSEAQAARSATTNDRLTVLLCFKDAVKTCLRVWSWTERFRGCVQQDTTSSGSFNYTSVRLRTRTRRALEHLFTAETLECLETFVEAWKSPSSRSDQIVNLLQTLAAARPKNAIPAIFNGIYSRTNPTVLDPTRTSSLTSELTDFDLTSFLAAYAESMDDDAMDEVWADCMTFLKDVLGNPMPQRQILGVLLTFIAILGEKIENTGFGEQRRMRKEIGDMFLRLLATNFTISPLSFSQDVSSDITEDDNEKEKTGSSVSEIIRINDIVAIVATVLPGISGILTETERMTPASTAISTYITGPAFRSKTFPQNISVHIMRIMQYMSHVPEASKSWRKDVSEAFNETRFFSVKSWRYVSRFWMPIMRQYALVDKERLPELLTRLPAPTTAGIVFGVGASSARVEADRKCQLNLRRVAFLILSADQDTFAPNVDLIQEKLMELLGATASSSPSSSTRAEIYMVFRALVLKTSPIYLSTLWPIINSELHDALAAIGHIASRETYNITCILQAAKLLDMLLILAPDEFQMSEWLYVTDTVDAIYRPGDWKPIALADELSEALGKQSQFEGSGSHKFADEKAEKMRRPLLNSEVTNNVPRERLLDEIIGPFLQQLSIHSFESTYKMEVPNRDACAEELLRDIFDESSLV